MSENARTLTLNEKNLQALEDYINEDEDSGKFLNEIGIISDEELAAGIAQDEDFRVKLQHDPELVATKWKELQETGEIRDMVKTPA